MWSCQGILKQEFMEQTLTLCILSAPTQILGEGGWRGDIRQPCLWAVLYLKTKELKAVKCLVTSAVLYSI